MKAETIRQWPRYRRTTDGATVHVATVRGLGFEEELGEDGEPLPPNPLTSTPAPYLMVEHGFKTNEEPADVTRIHLLPVPDHARAAAVMGHVIVVHLKEEGRHSVAMMTPATAAGLITPEAT
jgi:hypothetical protein